MSASNGIIRIGKKGLKKFVIGDEDDPRRLPVFEVDVVVAYQQWVGIDDSFRPTEEDKDGYRMISTEDVPHYHAAMVGWVEALGGEVYAGKLTVSEAMDFKARLQEQYQELAVFFQPRSREKPESPATSGAELRFSVEQPGQS